MKATARHCETPRCVCGRHLDLIQAPGFPSAIRVFGLTHSRRNVVQLYPWLIYLTHNLPSSFALPGLPVHVAASQLVPFSLGAMSAS